MASPISAANQHNSSRHSSLAAATPSSPPNKRDLKSWWKGFKLPSKQHDPLAESRAPGIFGVPLRQSITYANVAISLIDENGQSYIYGYVPIVVAKCGVFLKEKATGVEGIFRLSGSEKRIKELKQVFDSPDRYGKGLVWDGYTVHDAANVLRRYLNDLPEPVVPLALYEQFRDPLRGATKQPLGDADGPQFVENFDEQAAIIKYQQLITELPPLNRQLLLYILDLLAVFAAKSDENRMNPQNLAAIFQPGMLSHPNHAMAPEEYRLNQCVLIFLIENQDHFLIGMRGTAADENTKKEVESGTPTTPNVKGVSRTASNASAGANSVRKEGQLRRNRSVSSKHSRGEGSIGSHSPSHTATTTGGLGRSNTVPSKKSPALAGGKFRKVESPGQQQPAARLNVMTPIRPVMAAPESPASSPNYVGEGSAKSPTPLASQASGPSQERLLDIIPQESTPVPSKERNLPSLFQRSPAEGGEKKKPNKLKKKRIPGSVNISAQSSNASLIHSNAASPAFEMSNPMESIQPILEQITPALATLAMTEPPQSAVPVPHDRAPSKLTESIEDDKKAYPTKSSAPPYQSNDVSSELTPRASQLASHYDTLHSDDNLQSTKSPPTSIYSSYNEGSDLDQIVEGQTIGHADGPDKERKKRWRLSRTRRDDNSGSLHSLGSPPPTNLWSNTGAETSTTTVGSGTSRPRKSLTQDESSEPHPLDMLSNHHEDDRDNGKDDARGPIGWIKNKYREAKGNAEQRRNKSPAADRHADRQGISAALYSRGRSMDIKREKEEGEKPAVDRPSEAVLSPEPAVLQSPPAGPKMVEEVKPCNPDFPLRPVPEASEEPSLRHAQQLQPAYPQSDATNEARSQTQAAESFEPIPEASPAPAPEPPAAAMMEAQTEPTKRE
ncbi:uncharacterized protein UV8b_06539 [Ustilaginoidea virens]|uniref:Rho-GAP domain-containing protein n=1 Tax=Ustilaginoidea virens TaxID=1159556 RepID=A0A8E5HVX2_USTVR|nr:uncharacterized protein UV8b_06539 [Ustilaginoidea virens]QUC22298.1 hypothetical protein UV8b_06539 [Ustilaginoidea virens]